MIFVISGVVIVVAILGFCYYAYRVAFRRSKKSVEIVFPSGELYANAGEIVEGLISNLKARSYEAVEITSYDGLKLFGRYYHNADGAPVHLLVHGYRGNAIRDFCGGCKIAMDAGYNVLLIDQRSHGKSEGKTICFGVKEKYDVQSWVNYLVDRFGKDVKIVLEGVSMGAATVLEALALNLPDNVKGVVADCGYTSSTEIIAKVCKGMRYPVKITMPFIKLGAFLFGRFKLEGGAVSAVSKAKIPVFIVHGEEDDFVPCEMARRIYEACASEKYILTVPNATHGLSYIVDTKLYVTSVMEFMSKIL